MYDEPDLRGLDEALDMYEADDEHYPESCLSCPERGQEVHAVCGVCDRPWPCLQAEPDCDRACADCLRCKCICP